MALKPGLIRKIQFNFSRPFRDQTGADFEPFNLEQGVLYAAPKLGPQRIVTQAYISRAVFRS